MAIEFQFPDTAKYKAWTEELRDFLYPWRKNMTAGNIKKMVSTPEFKKALFEIYPKIER